MATITPNFALGAIVGAVITLVTKDMYMRVKPRVIHSVREAYKYTPWELYWKKKRQKKLEELVEGFDL